ncbi:MAG: hypothetical protein FJW27_03435 [Acidimicrobiia bacterium]|nr:hypothetical protein [Acidimicrobiia bacterium]
MSLLGSADQTRLRTEFEQLTRPVHLLFFTQSLGCETCAQTRQVLNELPALSSRVIIDEVNFVLEPDRARRYGIDRVPAIAVAYAQIDHVSAADGSADSGDLVDTRIRFLGTPAGYEFVSLVQAVLLAGGGESQLSEASRQRLASVQRPVTLHVFTTPT